MTKCVNCGDVIEDKQHSSHAYGEDGAYWCIECWHTK